MCLPWQPNIYTKLCLVTLMQASIPFFLVPGSKVPVATVGPGIRHIIIAHQALMVTSTILSSMCLAKIVPGKVKK